jgi:ferredoxin
LEGASFFSIDEARCTDCGACTSVCPIEGAVVTFAEPAPSNSPSVGEALQSLLSQAKLRARFDDRMAGRLALWATDCTARVVCLYEAETPTDRTVRNAVLAARERAPALFQFGRETLESVVKGRRVESGVKSRLEAARADCASWEEKVVAAAKKAQNPAAKIAADAAGAACINPFISISTFTRHIGEMVFGRRSGFWLGYFATAALTSGPCF